jgi:uncharacterized membrane protein YdbT with pleckstrin-like domain
MMPQIFCAMADLPHAPASPTETIIWKGSTSQWIHMGYYMFCLLLAAGCLAGAFFTHGLAAIGLVVPALMWAIRWWATKATFYTLTSERLLICHGILNRREDNLELYRVRDYAVEQPFSLRVLGLGNLKMLTSDPMTPNVTIHAIHEVDKVREALRSGVEAARDRKRVRQMDMDTMDGGADHLDGDLGHHP